MLSEATTCGSSYGKYVVLLEQDAELREALAHILHHLVHGGGWRSSTWFATREPHRRKGAETHVPEGEEQKEESAREKATSLSLVVVGSSLAEVLLVAAPFRIILHFDSFIQ